MDNQNQSDTKAPLSDPNSNQVPPSPTEPTNTTSKSEHQKINIVLLILLVATFLAALTIGSFIVADIKAGALNGKAETGFGFLLAAFFSPILIGLAMASFFRIRRARKQNTPVRRTVKLAVIVVIVLSIASLAYDIGINKYEEHAHRGEHSLLQQKIDANKPQSITINNASNLLYTCKLKNVYKGTDDTNAIDTEVRNSPEGVVLVKLNSTPYNIWVTEGAYNTLKPAIEYANKNCLEFHKS